MPSRRGRRLQGTQRCTPEGECLVWSWSARIAGDCPSAAPCASVMNGGAARAAVALWSTATDMPTRNTGFVMQKGLQTDQRDGVLE